eukprot:SAG11_NODE_29_length_23137_cov_16.739995_13_plen_165_part_00
MCLFALSQPRLHPFAFDANKTIGQTLHVATATRTKQQNWIAAIRAAVRAVSSSSSSTPPHNLAGPDALHMTVIAAAKSFAGVRAHMSNQSEPVMHLWLHCILTPDRLLCFDNEDEADKHLEHPESAFSRRRFEMDDIISVTLAERGACRILSSRDTNISLWSMA